MKPPSRIKNIAFAAIAVVIFFALVEIGLRLAGFDYMPDDTPLVIMRDFQRQNYKTLYHFDPGTLWSLNPGAVYEHEGTAEKRINRLGFRGPEVSAAKSPRTLRIACFGDSSAFGLGVQLRFIYTENLRDYLKKMLPGVNVEVINAGVVGYTSTQALAHLRRDVLPLKPDIVVASLGAINEVYTMKYTDAQRIAMVSQAGKGRTLRSIPLKARTGQFLLWLVRKIKGGDKGPLQPRAPLPQFKKDLEAFADEGKKDGFLLILVSPHRKPKIEKLRPELLRYSEAIQATAQERALPFVDVHGYFMKINDEKLLFRDDYHPSRQGHNLIAQILAMTILKEFRAGHVPGFPAKY